MKLDQYPWLMVVILILFVSACSEGPLLSVLDPNNPDSNGNPFNLKGEIQDQKVVLTWDKPDRDYDGFLVYLNKQELVVLPNNVTTYTAILHRNSNKSYTYQVCAQRDGHRSVFSSYVIPAENMVLIPAGSFENVFYMDVHEVTVGQFKQFVNQSDYNYPDHKWNKVAKYSPTDNHPMISASWHDATAYAKWAGKRLPTEAEWDYAARGGLRNKEYSWGDDGSLARDYANYVGTGGKDKWDKTTAPVGSFFPNGYGLYDMAGNAWEWCQDWRDNGKVEKVLRGGSWTHGANYMRLANSLSYQYRTPRDWPVDLGFRCVSGLN